MWSVVVSRFITLLFSLKPHPTQVSIADPTCVRTSLQVLQRLALEASTMCRKGTGRRTHPKRKRSKRSKIRSVILETKTRRIKDSGSTKQSNQADRRTWSSFFFGFCFHRYDDQWIGYNFFIVFFFFLISELGLGLMQPQHRISFGTL